MLQALPLLALSGSNDMKSMPCCKKGKDSCCRRKPMGSAPALQAKTPCGVPCCGQPSVSLHGSGIAAQPAVVWIGMVTGSPALQTTASEARAAAGVDPSLYQRPPPVSQA